MRHVFHISSWFLTAYFIALPILFGLHTIQHEHNCVEDERDDMEYGQYAPECELCDLYHSQTATDESSNFFVTNIRWVSYQTSFAENLAVACEGLKFLRGPPVA